MIKLLHLADIHLEKTFRMLGEKGAAQRKSLEAAFRHAVDLAVAERVNLVLIAGDLFDSPKPSPAIVEFVIQQLRRLDEAGIRTALVAGNHDVADDGYIGRAGQLRAAISNLIVFGRSVEVRILPDLDLTLIGRSAQPGAAASPLSEWPRGRQTRFAVGVTHGSVFRAGVVEGAGVIHPQEIRDLGLDYLALGDWHSVSEILPPPTAAWYAGAPELLAYDQGGAGHVLLVEVAAPGPARVSPQQIGRRRYLRLELDATTGDEPSLRRRIEEVADPDLVCDAVLSGLLPLDRFINARAIENELAPQFFRLRIHNRTHPWLEEDQLAAFPEETVIGRFVRLMDEHLATSDEARRPILEEAIQVGVALLQGREVLT